MPAPFVPDDFEPPLALDHEDFQLRPLGPEHNDSDYAAWTSSIDHIRATPGFVGKSWPRPMTLEENHGDLVRHAADFAGRTGFTYTVLEPGTQTVIGCVYIYTSPTSDYDVRVKSWVRAGSGPVSGGRRVAGGGLAVRADRLRGTTRGLAHTHARD